MLFSPINSYWNLINLFIQALLFNPILSFSSYSFFIVQSNSFIPIYSLTGVSGRGGKESAAAAAPSSSSTAVGEPNRILFLENLPEATNEAMLGILFQQFPGKKFEKLFEKKKKKRCGWW